MRRHPRPMGPPPLGAPNLGPPLRPPRGPPHPHMGPRGPALGMPPIGMGPPGPGVVSSCTNSNDPASMDSRLFVGNLNTVALSKDAVEAIFARYGMVIGISLHKGYAFVQFRHPDEARRAGASEDGKTYAGQAIDINIVSQPKNRNALKRSTPGRTNSTTTPSKKSRQDNPGTNQSLQRTLVTLSSGNMDIKRTAANNAVKRALATVAKKGSPKPLVKPTPLVSKINPSVTKATGPKVTIAATADVLICGTCKLQFSSLHCLAQHKKVLCRLRTSCQCQENAPPAEADSEEPATLNCATCDVLFNSAWALIQHCDQEHKMSIFKTTKPEEETSNGQESNTIISDVKKETDPEPSS